MKMISCVAHGKMFSERANFGGSRLTGGRKKCEFLVKWGSDCATTWPSTAPADLSAAPAADLYRVIRSVGRFFVLCTNEQESHYRLRANSEAIITYRQTHNCYQSEHMKQTQKTNTENKYMLPQLTVNHAFSHHASEEHQEPSCVDVKLWSHILFCITCAKIHGECSPTYFVVGKNATSASQCSDCERQRAG